MKPQALRALPADRDYLSEEAWQRLYSHLGVTVPEKDCRMTVTGEFTYPYFNSGVMCPPLLEHWVVTWSGFWDRERSNWAWARSSRTRCP